MTTNQIVPFAFDDQLVRTVPRDDGPWFVLADVCRVLEHSNPSMAAKALDDDERDALNIADPIGRDQQTTIINESGLYSLILTSRKPAAKRFKRWVTAEVLPAIRKTGGYGTAGLTEKDRAAIGGIAKAVVNKALAEIVPSMVHASLSGNTHALVRDHMTAGEILNDARVPNIGRRGLVRKTSNAMLKYCMEVGCLPHEASLGQAKALLFPRTLVKEWMEKRGRAMIAEHMAAQAGQTRLRLVAPRKSPPALPESANFDSAVVTRIDGAGVLFDAADYEVKSGQRYVCICPKTNRLVVLSSDQIMRAASRRGRAVMVPFVSGAYPRDVVEWGETVIVGRVVRVAKSGDVAA